MGFGANVATLSLSNIGVTRERFLATTKASIRAFLIERHFMFAISSLVERHHAIAMTHLLSFEMFGRRFCSSLAN
jgi:hypothetical protein